METFWKMYLYMYFLTEYDLYNLKQLVQLLIHSVHYQKLEAKILEYSI